MKAEARYRAGSDPVSSALASGAIQHGPWSPTRLPSATPEGRSPQCAKLAKSTWLSWTPQHGTKRVCLGNGTAHSGEMTACIDAGWVEVPTCRAQCHWRSCIGPLSMAGRYAVGGWTVLQPQLETRWDTVGD